MSANSNIEQQALILRRMWMATSMVLLVSLTLIFSPDLSSLLWRIMRGLTLLQESLANIGTSTT